LFESLIESRRDVRTFWRPATVAVALGLHAGVLGTILVENYFKVPPIHEPPIQVTFAHIAPAPPPPAPPPPAPKPAVPKPVVETPRPMPTEMVQPEKTPDVIQTEPMPEPPPVVSEGVEGGVPGGVPGGAPGDLPPLPTGPLRVGGDVTAPVLISRQPPQYPMMARSARVEGVVKLEAVIHSDGTVGDIKVLQPLRMGCTEAAIEALKRWRFKPGERNGVPVDVYYALTVEFRLTS